MTMTAGHVSTPPPSTRGPRQSPPPRRGPRAKRRKHRPRKLLFLAALTVAAGVLMAAIVAPLVVGAGLVPKPASDYSDHPPTVLPDPVLGRHSQILASDGPLIATLHG